MQIIERLKAVAIAVAAIASILIITFVDSPAQAGQTISTGQFNGANGHVTTGKVTIKKEGNDTIVILEDNFSLDGAPNPSLGFSKDGNYDVATDFSPLKSNTGRQVYKLPASINVENYDEIVVWCADFTVSLGSAKLH